MKPRHIVAIGTALVIAAGGGYAFAQSAGSEQAASGSCVPANGGGLTCTIQIAPPATNPSTTVPSSTTAPTTVPSTSTSTTAPSTTTSTTGPSTTAPLPSSTTSTPSTTSTVPPAGSAQFTEDFSTPGSFGVRFDHGWSGEVHAGSLFGADKNDWNGDHDGMCGDPLATHRVVHLGSGETQAAVQQVWDQCAPGGDNAKAHVMSSVNTEGYVIAWFSPKAVFHNVHDVCWDQNFTHLGGGKWTTVSFLTGNEYTGKTDLGYNDPAFADPNGPHVPNGEAQFGVETGNGGVHAWQNGQWAGQGAGLDLGTDHASRVKTCIHDNENGTLTIKQGTLISTVAGQIPNGDIRVVFNDDNYNPDKHYDTATNNGAAPPSNQLLTWHWDNIEVS